MDRIREQQLKKINAKVAQDLPNLQETPTKEMPSIAEMGKNLINTAVDTVKSIASGDGFSISKEDANRRLDICKQCEFFTGSRCTKCGCHMSTKTYLKAANCPVGKW